MTKDKEPLDALIVGIVKRRETETGGPVELEAIRSEAIARSDEPEELILQWIKNLQNKQLIRQVRPGFFAVTDLSEVAKNLGLKF